MSTKSSVRIFSMRSWAMLVAVTRRLSCEVFLSALANTGTMAAKMMPARRTVTKSSIMLKPAERACLRVVMPRLRVARAVALWMSAEPPQT